MESKLTYQQTLDFLFSQLPMFSSSGKKAYTGKLDNIIVLCEALGNPQDNLKCIHVAGTNGKGSTSHMFAAIFQNAGYKTGLYTSPHLFDFRERIKINGEPIPEEDVVEFVEKIRSLKLPIQPSFFEITVAMAFYYFNQQATDICIIETGLGGRLDSTNIIKKPIMSVITSIGLDHQDILGDTLEDIAREKIGIVKPYVPVLLNDVNKSTHDVIYNTVNEKRAEYVLCDQIMEVVGAYIKDGYQYCDLRLIGEIEQVTLPCDLLGLYQTKNMRTVYLGVLELRNMGYDISDDDVREALKNVRKLTGLRGRWEVIQENPTIILDVGHNVDGFTQILENLEYRYNGRKYHFVLGFVKDKEHKSIFQLLPTDASYYFTNAHMSRAMDKDNLQRMAARYNLIGDTYEYVDEALAAAKKAAHEDDVIIVAGSFFTLSELTDFPR